MGCQRAGREEEGEDEQKSSTRRGDRWPSRGGKSGLVFTPNATVLVGQIYKTTGEERPVRSKPADQLRLRIMGDAYAKTSLR